MLTGYLLPKTHCLGKIKPQKREQEEQIKNTKYLNNICSSRASFGMLEMQNVNLKQQLPTVGVQTIGGPRFIFAKISSAQMICQFCQKIEILSHFLSFFLSNYFTTHILSHKVKTTKMVL